jgi:hypothetical protein
MVKIFFGMLNLVVVHARIGWGGSGLESQALLC